MSIQKKDWGQIEWMENGSDRLFQTGMNVGVVTLKAGAHQQPHRHYDEQVLYVIQGQAISFVDGVQTILTAGKFFRLKAGIIHEIYNTGNIPFQHFIVSNPTQDDFLELERSPVNRRIEKDKIEQMMYQAVMSVRTQFLDKLHYAFEIYDWAGNLILQSTTIPTYCMNVCGKSEDMSCPCVMNQNWEKYKEQTIFYCANGLEIFHVPIMYNNNLLGYIQGGYIYQSNKCPQVLEKVYDTPDSAAMGIENLLQKIAKSIQNYCEFEELRQTMLEKDLEIKDSKDAQMQLLKNLQHAEYEMTDLKINNHFLFNTLNGMASMALENRQLPLYQSIVDLSKMFHYTLRTQSTLVPLKSELDYVKAYLQLQNLRYGDELQVKYKIDPECEEVRVPFNFLQPIVENAFVHGFLPEKTKKIYIDIHRINHKISIEIRNSGKVLTNERVTAVNHEIQKGGSHGMSMINQKLSVIYQDRYEFLFQRNGTRGMKYTILIPEKI